MTSHRSYKPIALLSVSEKDSEGPFETRMAWDSINFKILVYQLFGVLSLLSSVDLTTFFHTRHKDFLNKGHTASIATLDIKGTFDAVLLRQRLYRLRDQDSLFSFANRLALLRLRVLFRSD